MSSKTRSNECYEDNGDICVKDCSSRCPLGYYRMKYDQTADFYERALYGCNAVGMLIKK